MIEPQALTLTRVFERNCGFYIPNFQREFSWRPETATKLVEDIENSLLISIVRNEESHDAFLGTMIFLSRRYEVGVVIDDAAIGNAIDTVIDGQQRLSTLSVIGSVLSDEAKNILKKLSELDIDDKLHKLVIEKLNLNAEALGTWQSFTVTSMRAHPNRKPLIIRSVDASKPIAVDQWTLRDDTSNFYVSSLAKFLQCRIDGKSSEQIVENDLEPDSLLRAVAKSLITFFQKSDSRFLDEFDETKKMRMLVDKFENNLDFKLEDSLWTNYEQTYATLSSNNKLLIRKAIYIQLFIETISEKTKLVVIRTDEPSLAYDMFQSINGTGVPLTTIEVIKPDLVEKFRGAYGIQIQPKIKLIEEKIALLAGTRANQKTKITEDLIIDMARSYSGNLGITRIFSDQRWYLKSTIDQSSSEQCLNFISLLNCDLSYRNEFTKASISSAVMRMHLINLGMDWDEADIVVLIILYLNQSKHAYAHRVISIFYSNLVIENSKRNGEGIKRCCEEFIRVAKCCAAFFTIWKGMGENKFPDNIYRSLFSSLDNLTYLKGSHNQNHSFISDIFRKALNESTNRNFNINFSEEKWVNEAVKTPIYLRGSKVARFILLLAHEDALPDYKHGNGGLLRDGPVGCSKYLSVNGWERQPNSQIEHIAVQNPSIHKKYLNSFDENIYNIDSNAVHRIGNLTFLSSLQNPAVGQEWPEKLFFYWSLTNRGEAGRITSYELQEKLQLSRIPPSLENLTEGAEFVTHLAPIVQYGLEQPKWTLEQINRRGENIAKRAFKILEEWLG